jgi:hypothetical protein
MTYFQGSYILYSRNGSIVHWSTRALHPDVVVQLGQRLLGRDLVVLVFAGAPIHLVQADPDCLRDLVDLLADRAGARRAGWVFQPHELLQVINLPADFVLVHARTLGGLLENGESDTIPQWFITRPTVLPIRMESVENFRVPNNYRLQKKAGACRHLLMPFIILEVFAITF